MKIGDLLKEMGITQELLASLSGIPRSRIAKWAVDNKEPPKAEDADRINIFYEKFKNVSPDVLKEMADEPDSSYNTRKKEVIALGKKVPMRLKEEDFADAFPDWKGLPFYNVPVTASFIETYRDEHIYTPQFHLRDPRFKDCDFAAIVTGDSMHSEIRHGDFIICKEIIDRRFIVYGDIYYVVSTNGLETCKYINADKDDKNNLMLIAKNEHISPAPLPKDMVLKLYKVKGILRGY